MRGEIERRQSRASVDRENFIGPLAGIERDQQRDETLDDVGVGIAGEFQPAVDAARIEPDLAGAASHLVRVVPLLLRIRRKGAPEIDEVFVTLVPVVQKRKIRNDVVKPRHGVEIGEAAGAGKAAWFRLARHQQGNAS